MERLHNALIILIIGIIVALSMNASAMSASSQKLLAEAQLEAESEMRNAKSAYLAEKKERNDKAWSSLTYRFDDPVQIEACEGTCTAIARTDAISE